MVNNDGSRDSFVVLTGLKCIFQKQLPKMPKDYIARLVYDRSHLSMAIVKHPLEVVGYEYIAGVLCMAADTIAGGSHTDHSTAEGSLRSCFAPSHPINKSKGTARI